MKFLKEKWCKRQQIRKDIAVSKTRLGIVAKSKTNSEENYSNALKEKIRYEKNDI